MLLQRVKWYVLAVAFAMSLVFLSGATVPAFGMTNSSVAIADDDDDDRKDEKKRKRKFKKDWDDDEREGQWFDRGDHDRHRSFHHSRRWYFPRHRRGCYFRKRY